ncbi:MAG: class I SAM-dependent methyltransferase [Leptospirales bacterium]
MGHVFNPKMIERLDDPNRQEYQNPQKLADLIHPVEGKGFLDFGVGAGYFSFPLSERFSGNGPFYGLDIQQEMLDILRKRDIERTGKETIRPILFSGGHLPLSDGEIGIVLMVNVYHEIEDRRATLAELLRILSPAGSLFIIDWKKEETPLGPPLEERVPEVDIYDDLLSSGFDRIRSWDIYPWHVTIQAER